jgi:hypothetical protein
MRVVWVAGFVLWASAAAAQDMVFFQAPSGNIHCMIFVGDGDWQGARSDILQAELSYALRPADCDLDWGHAFEVPRRGASYPVCAGDTVASPDAPVLDYGRSYSLGGITCSSEKSGMTCTNAEGHGFTLRRASQRLF